MIHKLYSLLTRRDKQYLLGLFAFSILISVVETIGIGIIMPYIQLASDFTLIETNDYLRKIYYFAGFSQQAYFVAAIGLVLIGFYIFRSGVNLVYQYLLIQFAQGRYHLLAYRLFQNYLGMPYKEFVNKNSSYLTKSIVNEASNLANLLQNVLFLISEVFVLALIYLLLLYMSLKITLLLTLILAIKISLLKFTVTRKIKQEGIRREVFQKSFFEVIGSSFGNFKLIKLISNEKDVLQKFAQNSHGYARANTINGTLNQVPRLFLEAVGFSLMIFVLIYLLIKYNSDISAAIPLLSMYVLALYRLLPSVNRIISSYNSIIFAHRSLEVVHAELNYDIEKLGDTKIDFFQKINLKNINFQFEDDKPLFEDLNLTVRRGEKVAFVGGSGAGKSTLVDLMIGLYKPLAGEIFVDDHKLSETNIRSWRQKIGYIPQSIYLFDGTVAENIAFGRERDDQKIIEVLKKANIWDFLETKKALDTKVGEGGIQLSGGQKQRIAIARALYGDPEILVLDEATSALDNETEEKIMDEIYESSQDKTLLVIAHRLSTISRCDRALYLQDGRVMEKNIEDVVKDV